MFEIDGELAKDSRLIPPKAPYGLGKVVNSKPGYISSMQAWVFIEPRDTSSLQTQFTYGEGVSIYKKQGDFILVQSAADAYVGWVHSSSITYTDIHRQLPRYTTNCIAPVMQFPDMKSPILSALPIDSWLNANDKEGDYVQVENIGWVHKNHLQQRNFHEAIAETARRQLGRSYVWGGRGIIGLDCSALSQLCYRFAGLSIPRDTDLQQIYLSRHHQSISLEDLSSGDLIYIPGHVMIAIGNDKIIHASGHHMKVVEENLIQVLLRYRKKFGESLTPSIFRW